MFLSLFAAVAAPMTGVVVNLCPAESTAQDCQFKGGSAFQAAIDATPDGGMLKVRSGHYTLPAPNPRNDVAYQDIAMRAGLHIRGRMITLTGEDGVIIEPVQNAPMSAMVIERSTVVISHIEIAGFRYGIEEDKIYDGHGIFSIDSSVRLAHVKLTDNQKMAVTGRGRSVVEADGLEISGGHIGFWTEEVAQMSITNSRISNLDGVGICAYGASHVIVSNSFFSGLQDDGVYADDAASLTATNTVILNSKPFAVHAKNRGRIVLRYSVLAHNAGTFGEEAGGRIDKSDSVTTDDKLVDQKGQWVAGEAPKGDPFVRTSDGLASHIGL
jgi:hypothetical protein